MRPWLSTDRLESATDRPSVPTARDWVLAGLVAAITFVETAFRDDMVWRPLAMAMGVILGAAILWRRSHPLPALVLGFGTIMVVDVASLVVADEPVSLFSGGFVLVLVYSLLRRGRVVHAIIGMVVVVLAWAMGVAADGAGSGDAVGGALVLLLAAALGLAMRYRAIIRTQQFEQIRSFERENLARELHDTVAHHVSAIAIQSQAGRFLASAHDTDGTIEALRVIEREASMTLSDMRCMVDALRRDGAAAELALPHTLADIDAMATPSGTVDDPMVEVERRGQLADLSTSVETTLHRVAQECITNARRHARRPTRIAVLLDGRETGVSITVSDDGERVPSSTSTPGYGLVGMTERVALLGGTLHAGPLPDGGWRVEATMPRDGRRP